MVAGEQQHEAGRDGVRRVKRWLESTTRFAVPWDVYGSPNQTTVKLLSGEAKGYDIAGHLIGEDGAPGPPFYGEVKNYHSVSDQPALYHEYLARSYSAALEATSSEHDPEIEFMWVTWHPFSQTKFLELCGAEEIEQACSSHTKYLGEEQFDRSFAETLAQRLWLLIVNPRQDEMTMSKGFLGEVRRFSTMREPCTRPPPWSTTFSPHFMCWWMISCPPPLPRLSVEAVE
jgi:hypothetical protein